MDENNKGFCDNSMFDFYMKEHISVLKRIAEALESIAYLSNKTNSDYEEKCNIIE